MKARDTILLIMSVTILLCINNRMKATNKVLLTMSLILLCLYLIPTYIEPKVVKGLVTSDEIKHIKDSARVLFQQSTVGGGQKIDKTVRDSQTAWLSLKDSVVRRVCERCVSLTDRSLSNCEKLQVLKYKPGGYYKPHQDVIREKGSDENRRMYTIILALNDDYEGGETEFPILGKKYKLQKGDGLFFHTLNNYERVTVKALHGGSPVKSGEKWICNLWVHKYPYNS